MINQILNDRYQVQQQLARKAGRQTLLARDLETQELVVVKLLSFDNDFERDDLKLFEREAETLKALSHPCIPKYLDYFELNSQNFRGFALVQSYIEARSLESHLKAGRNFSEDDIKQIAKAILEILVYLHNRQLAVIHRDIKPSNILLGDRSGNSVGQVYLVDFGSVQNLAAREGGTMTVVGTYGYMPPEQFGGRTVSASDLYSLGATLIYLITGTHPADLPQNDGRIQFEHQANINPGFANWLKWMTQPSLDRRLNSASVALQSLNQEHHGVSWLPVIRQNSAQALRHRVDAFLTQCNEKFTAKTLRKLRYLKLRVRLFLSRRGNQMLCCIVSFVIIYVLSVTYNKSPLINSIYQQVLERNAVRVEKAQYGFGLAIGMTSDEIRNKIARSKEAEFKINNIYQQVLERDVDYSSEIFSRKSDLAKGMTLDKMRNQIAYSEEAKKKINKVYKQVLEPDTSAKLDEIARLQYNLAKGIIRFEQIRRKIVYRNSNKIKEKINSIFQQVLKRDATYGELQEHLEELYSAETSLSQIRDQLELIQGVPSRPILFKGRQRG